MTVGVGGIAVAVARLVSVRMRDDQVLDDRLFAFESRRVRLPEKREHRLSLDVEERLHGLLKRFHDPFGTRRGRLDRSNSWRGWVVSVEKTIAVSQGAVRVTVVMRVGRGAVSMRRWRRQGGPRAKMRRLRRRGWSCPRAV